MSVLEIAFLSVFWTWLLSSLLFLSYTFPPRPKSPPPHVWPEAGAQSVEFRATDGVRLRGWKIPLDPAKPWIICCHGYGEHRGELLPLASALRSAGFNLFLFDFRAHGLSDGKASSFGAREQQDLMGALTFLGEQSDIPPAPYGIYGISMGAAIALLVAGRDERLAAVAADGPYSALDDLLGREMRNRYPWIPRFPFNGVMHLAYRLRFGIWPQSVRPEEAAARLTPRALLLIAGELDTVTPVGDVQSIFAAASKPKELRVLPGAKHQEGYSQNPRAYEAGLVDFFRRHLVGATVV